MPTSVLIVDDERTLRIMVGNILRDQGCEILSAACLEEARQMLEEFPVDVVILDQLLPDGNGLALLEELAREGVGVETIVLTAHGDVSNAVHAMKNGAYHYLTKPFDADELTHLVERAAEAVTMRRELHRFRAETLSLGQWMLVGETPAMQQIMDMVERVAPLSTTVLITGESGTGKEVIARAIHARSTRSGRAFVAINCAAIPDSLLESELFGYEAGAFSGAKKQKRGLIEMADRGTLFLDEIGSMKLEMQAKLLRALENHTFTRLGATREVKVDLRLLAASNRDLLALIRAGEFREDLFFRIGVVRLNLPPLRERVADLPGFVTHFLAHFSRETGKAITGVSPAALDALRAYRWPGNIRELRNVMERAVVFADGETIELRHLPAEVLKRENVTAQAA
jgi:two-component system response regulator AtoC